MDISLESALLAAGKKYQVKSLLDMNTVSYYIKWFSKIGMLKEKTTTV